MVAMVEGSRMSKEKNTMRARMMIFPLFLTFVALAIAAAGASASPFKIKSYEVAPTTTEAGGHPDVTASLELEGAGDPEVAKNVMVNLPEGIFGNPDVLPICTSVSFALNECGSASQVGIITVRASYEGDPNYLLGTAPLYLLEARGTFETARLGFVAPTVDIPINIPVNVRTAGDYGLRMTVTGITQQIPLVGVDLTVWGFPASHDNDPKRFRPGTPSEPAGCPGIPTAGCIPPPYPDAGGTPVQPFIDNPTSCTGNPLPIVLEVETYQDPTHPSRIESDYPATTECHKQQFNPVLNFALTNSEADAPAGMDVEFRAPQFLGLSNSPTQLRSARLTLPPELTINPDAADGQSACSNQQANFDAETPDNCPDNAKIGTFEMSTPSLTDPLTGAIYIGEPVPGNQYRAFLVASGFGIYSKLVAEFHPDPETGQVTMSVVDLPQVPFEKFNIHLFASDRGLMATPTRCGIYRANSVFTPWNASLSPQESNPIVAIESGPNNRPCPGITRPFNPRLVAGSSNSAAGEFTDFRLRLDRDDGDQFLGDLNFKLPKGFTGSLRGLTYCPEAGIIAAEQALGRVEQAHPSCPASSQVGTTNVAAGPGSHPFHAVGKMYLAGPFKGAPLSVVAVTPALAGPYDYGVVVVRVAMHVNPLTAQVSAISDTVPSIIGGIPIRLRSIQVSIDKPNFTINPTNCSPFTVDSQGIGDQGTVTNFSSYFQVVNCTRLPFKPKMTVRRVGRKGTHRAQNPELQFDLRTRAGDANIKSVSVTLSHAFEIDQRHLGNICSEKELIEKQCAGSTPIGKATTRTPLLDEPLSGPAYAVSGSGGLPRLAFILNGQVTLIPRADTTTTRGGQLRTIVPVVPDAPIGHFRLNVFGGKTGYLINTRDICAQPTFTRVAYVGQNGKAHSQKVKLKAACGKKKKKRAKRHSR
jgi:hypothetical protein